MKIEACEPSGSLCHRLRTVFADKRPLQMAAAAIHLVILLSASLLASPAQAQTTLRVRSADTGYTDSVGHVWSANYGSTGGDPANWGSISIANTSDPALYRTEQYGDGMQYAFTVPNGSYEVRLHFSENDTDATVGSRVFNVQVEGSVAFANVDVFSQAGGHRTALIKTATVTVSDGQINLLFTSVSGTPMIQALEIVGQATDTQVPTTPGSLAAAAASSSQINLTWTASTDNVGVSTYVVERCQGSSCTSFSQIATPTSNSVSDTGLTAATTYRYRVLAKDAANNVSSYSSIASATTSASSAGVAIRVRTSSVGYTDSQGHVWSANYGSTGGSPADWGSITIANTSDPALYRTEQYGNGMQYTFTVPNGSYEVRLHFSENDTDATVGSRVFDVQIEGTTMFSDLDVFALAGAHRTALIETATVVVSDGHINIQFTSDSATPMVQALEVLGLSSSDSQVPTAPSGLSALAASNSRINLSWTAATDNVAVTGYLIERCQGSGCSTFTQVATASGTTFADTGRSPSTTYRYRVRAKDAANNTGGYSSIASATTPLNSVVDCD